MLKICQKLKRGFCICSPPGNASSQQVPSAVPEALSLSLVYPFSISRTD
jgi:hypothetical protein